MSDTYETPERKTDIAREVWILAGTLRQGSQAHDMLCEVAEWLDDGCCYDLNAQPEQGSRARVR